MKSLKLLVVALCLTFSHNLLLATHNIGAELQFKQTGPNTVEGMIISYTRSSSAPADRDTLILCWGDGTCDRIPRINGDMGQGELIGPNLKKNVYIGLHTYSEEGRYTLSMTDPNRNGGIVNIYFPNSDQIKMHVQAEVNVLVNGWENNHSPVLLEAPIDNGILGQPFAHVPNAFDIDDDSIEYQLIVPYQDIDQEVPNYQFPDMVNPSPSNNLSIDSETGEIRWVTPQRVGDYTIAVKMTTYRNGEIWDVIIRDFLVTVSEAVNTPPIVVLSEANPEAIEVVVGNQVTIDLSAEDMEVGQLISISSSCGLYDFYGNPATFTSETDISTGTGQFQWDVLEEHVRTQPYQVVFKVKDINSSQGLATFRLLRFKVSAGMTSTDALINNESIFIFPNPTARSITIKIDKWKSPVSYHIFNAKGEMVASGQIVKPLEELPLPGFANGFYTIQLDNQTKSFLITK